MHDSHQILFFFSPLGVPNALLLNETMFKGRPLKVIPKRTNVPGGPMGAPGAPGGFGYASPIAAPPIFSFSHSFLSRRGRGAGGFGGGYAGYGRPAYGRGGRGRGRGRRAYFAPY